MWFVDIAGEVAQELFQQNSVAGVGDRHPVVAGVEFGQLGQMFVHDVGEMDQCVAAMVHRQCHPLLLRLPGDGDRTVDLGGTGQRDHCVRDPGRWVDVVMYRCRGDPVVTDEQPDGLRHEAASSAHS